jgi:aspartyl-tRNA(Asn)/glutamyl-tRNA(Gln) amidotransferase subunit B
MAISEEVKKQYIPTIGIETHVQLKTKTKLFAAVGNDARGAEPNTLISHICVGMPGALPVLNEQAVELTAKAAFALGVEPQRFSKFDRKHYFYPDLPKGYQITQYDKPLIVGGKVEIEAEGEKKTIGITRAHLEEDAGKNTHPEGADYSLVDLNRAGTPLLEIVSEPEIHSAVEAKAYARELWLIMKYADVTEGDLYHGHVRFDVNVSVSKDAGKQGIRAEVKNLNSFRSVEGAVNFEIERQIELLEKGEQVVQETRGWDEAKQKTTSQREKEEAHDYRYMPEPDIPPVELSDEYIKKMQNNLAELPHTMRGKLAQLKVDGKVIENILDNPEVYQRISEAMDQNAPTENIRRLAFDSLENPEVLKINVNDHIKIAEMVSAQVLSSTAGSEALQDLVAGKSVEESVESRRQVSDEDEIDKIVEEVLSENPKAAEDVKNGEMKAIGFLVGQVMKKSQGKANPSLAQKVIKKHLEI